jgi:ABC-type multidrug transport system ATPase subunit
MNAQEWVARLSQCLADDGLEPGEAHRLAQDALNEAADAQAEPGELYGPVVAYAATLVSTVRTASNDAAPLRRVRGPVVLRLRDVGKRYGRRQILRDVNLSVRGGEIAAVVGQNGSGKSTLLDICAGLSKASSGSVERTARIGFAPQLGGTSDWLTPEEHFRLFGAAYGMRKQEAVAVGSRLTALLGWKPKNDLVAARLSGGTRQKLNVACAQLNRPSLILLDEPYQGFDQDSYASFWNQVLRWRDAGAGVLIVTHMLHDLDQVDTVLELYPLEEN